MIRITGIDLSKAMLEALAAKFPDRNLNLICNSYFETDLGVEKYNAAVSVESLHHFTNEQKLSLYRKLFRSLKANGYFILTDYFAESEALEAEYFETLEKLKREQGITDHGFYHYDTPLTVEHEIEILKKAGFSDVKILKNWGAIIPEYKHRKRADDGRKRKHYIYCAEECAYKSWFCDEYQEYFSADHRYGQIISSHD